MSAMGTKLPRQLSSRDVSYRYHSCRFLLDTTGELRPTRDTHNLEKYLSFHLCGMSKELQSTLLGTCALSTYSRKEVLTPERMSGQTQACFEYWSEEVHPLYPRRSIASGGSSPCSTCKRTVSARRANVDLYEWYCIQSVVSISSGSFWRACSHSRS
jgi:hypothetical protein